VFDELNDSDVYPDFNLGDKIERLKYAKLIKVKSYKGRKRIVEESEGEDSYTASLEEGDSERNLEYVFTDVDGDNENTIVQKEIDWYGKWNKYYKWDEDKKEYNSGGVRVPKEFVVYSNDQIQKVEARKKRGYNLKRKHLIAIFMNFDPDAFDINEDYEKEWTKKYNKEKVKLLYETKKRIMVMYHFLQFTYNRKGKFCTNK
jgi:hypothetical protein